MTLEETMKQLNLSECTLKHHFKRTQENLAKRGIILTKTGVKEYTRYEIEYRTKEK